MSKKNYHTYSDLVALIENEYENENFLKIIQKFMKIKFDLENLDILFQHFFYKENPYKTKRIIFGTTNDSLDEKIYNNNCLIISDEFEDNKTNCWICGNIICLEKHGKPLCEKIIPFLRAIMYISLLLTKIYKKEDIKHINPLLKKNENEKNLWSHVCCNEGKKTDFWVTFNNNFFLSDVSKITESLRRIKNLKKCNNITKKNINKRKNIVSLRINNLCQNIRNEMDAIKVIFTPTIELVKLYILNIHYILCIIRLNNLNTTNEIISSENANSYKFGLREEQILFEKNKELFKQMNHLRDEICDISESIKHQRLYKRKKVIEYCEYQIKHRDELNMNLSYIEKHKITQFFESCLNFKHLSFKGVILSEIKFIESFGWSTLFIDNILGLIKF